MENEENKRDCACVILYDDKKQVLIQKKTFDFGPAPGYWVFFGGRIKNGETPYGAVIREIKEELGIEIYPNPFDIVNYKVPIGTRKGKEFIYTSKLPCNLDKLVIGEGAGIALFTKKELKRIQMPKHQMKALKKFYDPLK